jgi:hypothetical protein
MGTFHGPFDPIRSAVIAFVRVEAVMEALGNRRQAARWRYIGGRWQSASSKLFPGSPVHAEHTNSA